MKGLIATVSTLLFSALTFSQIGSPTTLQSAPPSIRVEPSAVDFGNQVSKKPSKPQRITVTNAGGKELYINSAVLTGDDKQDFTLGRDTCTGATIGSGKSCILDVVFTPSVTERRKAAIVLTNNSTESTLTISLIGIGINSSAVPPRTAAIVRHRGFIENPVSQDDISKYQREWGPASCVAYQ